MNRIVNLVAVLNTKQKARKEKEGRERRGHLGL
jgi:hypothetical protein